MAIVIKVGGVDVTPIVIYEDAEFTTRASGQPGSFHFRVKDVARTHAYITGAEVSVDVGADRVFTGYLTTISHQYFFPVTRTDLHLPERALVLEGVDINVLFTKRVVANLGDPSFGIAEYAAGTFDTVIIADLIANFLDLSGDSLDTSSLVDHVGSPVPDFKGVVAQAGDYWNQAMNQIVLLTGAIYYIDPDRKLVHTDVDTPNAPYKLSDTPGPDGALGYRELELLTSGTDLINDAMVWGVGNSPSQQPTFARVEDATSIADHGRWQWGDFRQDLFQQASVTHRAESMVYGSILNHRGHKDDITSVTVTLFDPSFRVAQKVDFSSHVFGFQDVIPIRVIHITFPTPDAVKFDLTLSHFADEPWNTAEFWWPAVVVPKPVLPTLPSFTNFQMIDSFDNRVLHDPFGVGWGDASGYPTFPWTAVNGEVYNGNGWMQQPGEDTPSVGASLTDYSIYDFGVPWIGLWKFSSPYDGSTNVQMQVGTMGSGALPPIYCYVNVGGINTVANYYLMVWIVNAGGGDVRVRAKQWLISDAIPGAWDTDATYTPPLPGFFYLTLNCDWVGPDSGLGGGIFRVDFVMQLFDLNLPIFISEVSSGWASLHVVPEPDHTTLLLGIRFAARTARVRIDGNIQSIAEYTAYPAEGRIVFSVPIPIDADVVVDFFANGPVF